MLAHQWHGNGRERENVLERAIVLADGDVLSAADLPERLREPDAATAVIASGELSIKKTTRFIEETLIRKALEKTGGNRTQRSEERRVGKERRRRWATYSEKRKTE